MKHKVAFIVVFVSIIISILACSFILEYNPASPLREKGTLRVEPSGKVVLIIEQEMDCVPVKLYLYDDSTYELLTEHRECGPLEDCILPLIYTKSIKGTYDFDLTKILDNSTPESEISSYQKIEYRIYPGTILGGVSLGDNYDQNYVIKKGSHNKYLKKLLKEINVNLNECSIPDYNK